MRTVILGQGGREHAIAWRISQDNEDHAIFVSPGNAGIGEVAGARNLYLNPDRLVEQIAGARADYVIIGADTYLVGVVDGLVKKGIPVFGPSEDAAKLEISKSFALDVMEQAHVPRPKSDVFSNPKAVVTYAKGYGKPVVVKADGLAQGKGVWPCYTLEEVEQASHLCWELYGEQPIVVQELLEGQEISVFCFTDGVTVSSFAAARDYKRLLDRDQGPNTGGMGSYAWPKVWNQALEQEVLEWIVNPTLRAMAQRGTPFSGMLYVGIMLTKGGPKVLEFNARFGDSEAQVILPLLKGNLLEIMQACTEGRLHEVPVDWHHDRHAVGVVMASEGYPGEFKSGYPITRKGQGNNRAHQVFHASTKMVDGVLVTDKVSGRVLTVVGMGKNVAEARRMAYDDVGRISFLDATWREDVGSQLRTKTKGG
jgi:phosphoribosylamine---glycine ligase